LPKDAYLNKLTSWANQTVVITMVYIEPREKSAIDSIDKKSNYLRKYYRIFIIQKKD
jgi:hypothetical protein